MKKNIRQPQRSQTRVHVMRAVVEIGIDGKLKIFPVAESEADADRIAEALRREFAMELRSA